MTAGARESGNGASIQGSQKLGGCEKKPVACPGLDFSRTLGRSGCYDRMDRSIVLGCSVRVVAFVCLIALTALDGPAQAIDIIELSVALSAFDANAESCLERCMNIFETELVGVKIVEQERRTDNRGYFARTFCQQEFTSSHMITDVAQMSVSFSERRGTLRGLHFQYPPASETKYVRCVRGAMLDVVVDMRPESSTYLRHMSVMLSMANGRAVYVPGRFAHGFITLTDQTEVEYIMNRPHDSALEGGLRYDDPKLAILWPIPVVVIAERDTRWPLLETIEDQLARRMRAEQKYRWN